MANVLCKPVLILYLAFCAKVISPQRQSGGGGGGGPDIAGDIGKLSGSDGCATKFKCVQKITAIGDKKLGQLGEQ